MAPVHSVWLSIITQTRHQLNMVDTDSETVSLLCMCVHKSSSLRLLQFIKLQEGLPGFAASFHSNRVVSQHELFPAQTNFHMLLSIPGRPVI